MEKFELKCKDCGGENVAINVYTEDENISLSFICGDCEEFEEY